jgi:hypothetical protein
MPLARTNGVSIERLSLVLEFATLSPNNGAAVLVYEDRRQLHLGRFDFGAAEGHSNRRAISSGVTGLAALVKGSHVHPFGVNEALGRDAFLASKGTPPAAVAIDDRPPSFRERMRTISQEFSINDLDGIPPPPYQGDLWR